MIRHFLNETAITRQSLLGACLSRKSNCTSNFATRREKGRWDFPELKEEALKQYKYWEPDTVILEAKASGMPLT